jgi:probable rRNA maturation factor
VRMPVAPALVRRIVLAVLSAERRAPARRSGRAAERPSAVTVTFLSRPRMRQLNRAWKRRNRPTDVIAFALPLPDGTLAADVYICPAEARAEAMARGLAPREELIRLMVHGTLHVLGYDHPETSARTRSPMWRRQERYVRRLA